MRQTNEYKARELSEEDSPRGDEWILKRTHRSDVGRCPLLWEGMSGCL